MRPQILSVLLFSVLSNGQYLSCPLLGPDYPVPSDLQNDAQIISASQNLTQQLNSLINSNSSSFDTSTSFSIEWFTSATSESLFQYHYTGPSVAQSSNGTHNITGDSVYRVGSTSKLYTMYLFLAEAGDEYFTRPITDFVPELAQAAQNSTANDSVYDVQWEDVTIGALASHMAGISRDGMFPSSQMNVLIPDLQENADGQSDLLALNAPWADLGFPVVTSSELPSCGFNASVPACNRAGML